MESFAEETLTGRRLVVFGLTAASLLGFGLAMGDVLASGGWSWPRLAILILFLAGMPWTLLAFWNSIIGFVILRLVADPAGYTNPALRRTPEEAPITARVAICLAIRHEDVARVFARLASMIESLEATPWAHRFCLPSAERQQPARDRRGRGASLRSPEASSSPRGLPPLPAPPGECRLQGG